MNYLLLFIKFLFIFRKAREFVQKHGFDGIDLHYEYPGASDRSAFALWVEDIANEFHPNGLDVRKSKIIIKVRMHSH